MSPAKARKSNTIAWFGPIQGILVIFCFIAGFLFSSMDAYQQIWLLRQILTFGIAEPELVSYPEPIWLGVWLACLIINRVLVGDFRFVPRRKRLSRC